jgi:hypothetical protein
MNEAIDAARRELLAALRTARAALTRARVGASDEELAALQRQALGGELGPEMRRLAHRVADGSTTWAAVIDGSSPDADLTRAHVTRMVAVHGSELRRRVR